MNRFKEQWTGFTLESFIAVFLVAIAAALMLAFYMAYVRTADEGILKAQLTALRMQQKLFRVVHGRDPLDLKELVYDDYSLFPMGGRDQEEVKTPSFLDPDAVRAVAVNSLGDPVDPWGTPYEMDPLTKRIFSATRSYESW